MGLIDKFDIAFDSNPPVYCEGNTVSGKVNLIIAEDIRCKCVRFELHGVSVVHWTRLCINDKDSKENQDVCKTKANVIHQEYFEKVVFLERDGHFLGKDRVLSSGEHCFNFSVKLPCELPSSFEGEYGQVRYTAVAVIERSGFKSNIVRTKAFTVLTGLDLSFIPEAMIKIEICKYKKLGRLRPDGAVTIDWVVNRSGFVPGEEIWVNGSIQNDSKQTVLNSSVALFMEIMYKARRKWKKERRKIVDHVKGPTAVTDVTIWNESLIIPPLPPTGLNRSKVIDISYELEFRVSIAGGNQPVVVTKQIYIGTVPVTGDSMSRSYATMLRHSYSAQLSTGDQYLALVHADMLIGWWVMAELWVFSLCNEEVTRRGEAVLNSFNPNYALKRRTHSHAKEDLSASIPSLTDAIAAAALNGVVDVNPTAPSLTTLRRDSLSLVDASDLPADIMYPPPFAPGHYIDDEVADSMLNGEFVPSYDEEPPLSPTACEPSAPSENTLNRPWSDGAADKTEGTVDQTDEGTELSPTLVEEPASPIEVKQEEGESGFQPVYFYYPTVGRKENSTAEAEEPICEV